MLFSSLTFILVFLPTVLAAAFLSARLAGKQTTILLLIVASLVFYSWNIPLYLSLLCGSILINFFIGGLLERSQSKPLLTLGVILNLSLLGWFKYAGLFTLTLNEVFGTSVSLGTIILPLAISFFTFQQIAYLIDVYRKDIRAGSFFEYTFFIAFFPQLIAGPIVHYREIIPQLQGERFSRFLSSDLLAGLMLFSLGLAKKVLIADPLRIGGDQIFHATSLGMEPSMFEAWVGMLCYSFQIYFDFSGYSDMALGLGRMFGLKLPMNFFSPYKSRSIIEFWRRWNITLSHFLRDYLYFPLGGNRQGPMMRYINLFIVMLLGGLWHGASWTFVVWGGLHGLYLTINHAWRHFVGIKLPLALSIIITFIAVVIAWVFFRADNFDDAFKVFSAMFCLGSETYGSMELFTDFQMIFWVMSAAALITWLAPNNLQLLEKFEKGELGITGKKLLVSASATLAAFSIFKVYSTGTYEFLYFQF